MNPIYEYIAAIFVMTLIVGYSLYSLNTMSSSQLNLAYEEQLQPVAARLFDKILLTKGYPEDWGSNIYINNSNLGDFGLSSQSGEMYKVDVDKLSRLVDFFGYTINPLYIYPTIMGDLTGIYEGTSWSYGFRLRMKSALNINVTCNENEIPKTTFKVDVTNYWGRYAGNAEVNGLYFAIWHENPGRGPGANPPSHGYEQNTFGYSFNMTSNMTNWQGQTILDFTDKMPTVPETAEDISYILFTSANYYGIQSQRIDTFGQIQTVTLLLQEDYLIGNYTEVEGVARAANFLDITVVEFTSNQQVILDKVTNESNGLSGRIINSGRGGKSYEVFQLEDPAREDIMFAGLLVWRQSNWTLAFCSRPAVIESIDYRSHSFAYAGINTETYTRLVRFGTNSFYAELTVWRMSQ